MRNCVADLDPVRFQADSLTQDHHVDLLVEKWAQRDFFGKKDLTRIVLDCQFDGTLCESCLEFATLDRILYNLINNAARSTSDGLVHFYILPVPNPSGDNIRFVVANRVSEENRQVLLNKFQDDLSEIFRGGFTTEGNGVGTRICADFCAHAYGIFDFVKAKEAGYFGARWMGDYYTAWFHWPRMGH
jgi:signal transduction histidine kinase